MRVYILATDTSASGEEFHSIEVLELSRDQVEAINNERQMGVAPWVKAACEIDLDVLSPVPEPTQELPFIFQPDE